MKLVLGLSAVLSLTSFADRDTIPLGQRTSGPKENSIIAPAAKISPESEAAAEIGVDVANPAEGESEKPYIASLETYGSSRINDVILKETLGKDLQNWLTAGLAGAPDSIATENKLAERIKNKFGFASAEWSIIQYFEPGNLALHLTLDVVEKDEAAKRMPFLAAPKDTFKDPGDLIKQWTEYEDTALDLVESGALEPEADSCVAFHCPFGHKHPKLKKWEKIFVDGVKKHSKELADIQSKEKRPEFRAAATYLLAYLKDGRKVVTMMVDRIKDPDATVRNNSLRVLGDIAEFHPEHIIPIKPVLEAFNFPRVSDRSKSIYLAYLLSLNSQEVRDELMKSSVPTLIQIMGSKQPDHKELAHNILRKISGKDYPVTDSLAWSNWYGRLPKDRNISKK